LRTQEGPEKSPADLTGEGTDHHGRHRHSSTQKDMAKKRKSEKAICFTELAILSSLLLVEIPVK
jgi:hypothetical protein